MRRLALLILLLPGIPAAADEIKPTPPDDAVFASAITPLLSKYCAECHGKEKPKAELDLTKYGDAASVGRDRKVWERVAEFVETGEMPPKDKPKPTAEEVNALVEWIEAKVSTFDCKLETDPGRVTMRRLNRTEYDNTVRDLIGLDLRLANDFPSDDVGYGFDNIGDVLTISPILMEKYLAAAEKIADAAIVTDRRTLGPEKRVKGKEFPQQPGGHATDNGWEMPSNAEATVEFDAPSAGEYDVRIRAFGHQAGTEPVKMAMKVDGRPLGEPVEVRAVLEEPGLFELPVKLEPGKHKVSAEFLNDYYKPDGPENLRGDRNLILVDMALRGPNVLDAKPLPESHKKIIFREVKPGDEREAAFAVIEKFTTRAYRRPTRRDEVERLVLLAMDEMKAGGSFEAGIRTAVEATLVSPHFLFRVEARRRPRPNEPKTQPGKPQPIGNWEMASRLSYFLWSSMPDDELFTLARDGKLMDPAVIEAQARRMLKDPKASALVENFAGQWLQLRNLKTITPAASAFPQFDDALRSAMQKETELFFKAIVDEDLSVLTLLDADFTFVNERLAKHYGIDGIRGDEFRKVPLTGDRRGGVLTQAGVLTVTSNPTRTSPVKRGRWVLEQILGTPPPPPPPNVPELKEDQEAIVSGSLRQRMEKHRSDPSCAQCHARLDPLGFGLENYDGIGAWREKDGNFPIDASGELPGGAKFSGPKELKGILLGRKREFERCLTDKLLTYALGRGLGPTDTCAIDGIVDAVEADGDKFSRLVAEVVKSAPFRSRSTEEPKR